MAVRLPKAGDPRVAVFDNPIDAEDAENDQVPKGTRWMVRLSEAMKDVPSCDKSGGVAQKL